MLCVVLANTNDCRIYLYDKSQMQLSLLNEISHPEFRLKTSEAYTSERPGRYQGSSTPRGAYSPRTDEKESAQQRFLKEVADELNKGRVNNTYQKFVFITAPAVSGALFQELNQQVKNLIWKHIQKDCQHLSQKELLEFIHTNTKFQA